MVNTNWPMVLLVRDTGVNDDPGNRIYTTAAAGHGYERMEYIRRDVAYKDPEAVKLNELIDLSNELDKLKRALNELESLDTVQIVVGPDWGYSGSMEGCMWKGEVPAEPVHARITERIDEITKIFDDHKVEL